MTVFDREEARKALLAFRAINHPSIREPIISLLEEKERMTVTDIYETLGLVQSVASSHLAILKRASIVKTERSKGVQYYVLDHEGIEKTKKAISLLI
jgi:predicted transcriptional regulator